MAEHIYLSFFPELVRWFGHQVSLGYLFHPRIGGRAEEALIVPSDGSSNVYLWEEGW